MICEFRCSDGRCIPSSEKCDGKINCSDHSDEDECDSRVTCGSDNFHCNGSYHCISPYVKHNLLIFIYLNEQFNYLKNIYFKENGDVMGIKTVLMVLMSGIVQINLEKDVQLVVMVNLFVKMVIAYHLEIDVMAKKIVPMAVMKTELCVH